MLYVEKIVRDTVSIKVKNRIFYAVAISGISHEETTRLSGKLYAMFGDEFGDIGSIIHQFWWEDKKVAIIFMTGDLYNKELYEDEIDIDKAKVILDEFDKELKIPHISIKSGDEIKEVPSVSMIGMSAKDEDGEFSIFASNEEIFTGCMR